MTTPTHASFIEAIHNKTKVRISFFSKDDKTVIERVCAPMDYGISRRSKDSRPRYHLWDYDSDSGKPHTLSLEAVRIRDIEYLDEHFDPSEFVTWDVRTSPWHIQRDWGQFS